MDIVDKFQITQLLLEKLMSMSSTLQKRSTDLFVKLKQAEKDFKILIDFIIEKPQVINILSVKDFFRDSINSIYKILNEIPAHSEEINLEI